MITIFNRKELFSTYDIKIQAQIREVLAQNRVDYRIKIINRESLFPLSPAAQRLGRAGQKTNFAQEYKIYVHKDEAEKAAFFLRNAGLFCR